MKYFDYAGIQSLCVHYASPFPFPSTGYEGNYALFLGFCVSSVPHPYQSIEDVPPEPSPNSELPP